MWSSHTYHEPSATLLVIITSFLYFLNLFGWIAQKLISAGLLGQILIGIIYGTPVAGWLGSDFEEAVVGIGYVGLLIVVFEGGMTTSLDALLKMLPLSTCVALTGLLTPIALSFILTPAFGYPLINSFAAGAALSSTSLGTILTVLQPRVIGFDIRKSKLGVVLLSAAVMDDVVAFILTKILAIIGSGSSGGNELGAGIGRTIGVTIGLAVVAVPVCRWVLKPLYRALIRRRGRWEAKSWGGEGLILAIMAVLFIGMIAAAGYGGTSPLYGVYLAGLITSYLTREPPEPSTPTASTPISEEQEIDRSESHSSGSATRIAMNPIPPSLTLKQPSSSSVERESPFLSTFETYLYPTMTYLLLPLFFGSIGYSIPFVALWKGEIIWKGIVYAILMIIAKAICGLWLLIWPVNGNERGSGWRAALFLGMAMVARGEIGLLISQIAYHTPQPLYSEKEFLIVIWAILLATIIGPIGAGWVIRKWRQDVLRGGWD